MGRAVRIGIVVLVVGGVVVGLAWALQRSLVYHPDAQAPPSAADVHPGGRDLTLSTADGLELDAWLLPPTEAEDRETAVLYAPGNAGNRAGRLQVGQALTDQGFTVLLMDYRGFGGNPGSPSEDGLAADADAAAAALKEEGFDADRTLHVGESLGTGVVAALQARTPPAGVLLRSPFTSLVEVGAHHYPWLPVRALLRDRFPVTEHLAGSQVPVSVVHGDADEVVPSPLSVEVAQTARDAGTLVEELVLPGMGHNDAAMFGAPVVEAVGRLADQVVGPAQR